MGRGLPRNVERQVERANEILKKLKAGQDPNAAVPSAVNTLPAPAPSEPPATPPIIPPAEPPAIPDVPPAPVAAEPPATPPAPAPSPASCTECPKWQQRFTVLQGKYDAEVPRYAYRVQYLENQVQDLTGQIEALKSTPATPPTSPATPATSIADVLKNSTDEKMKSFRDNFPDVFEGMTQIVNLMEGQIRQDTDRKLSALESHSVQDRQTKFAKAMNDKHLGWSTMGQDLNWAMWLSQKDRYSPKRRLDLLKDANASLDSEAVINLIDDFKAEMAKAGIAPATPPLTPAPVAPTVPFVAPPSGPSPAPPMNPPPQDAVTRSFINQFYQDKVRGKYKGRDEEIKKIQAKIDKAVAAGKVINR